MPKEQQHRTDQRGYLHLQHLKQRPREIKCDSNSTSCFDYCDFMINGDATFLTLPIRTLHKTTINS